MSIPIEKYLEDLEKLINTDSGTMNIAGNDFMAGFFADRLEAAGYETEILRCGEVNRPVVTAKSPNAGGHFDLYLGGHLDTVYPDGTASQRPFRREDDRVYGPGTIDMKSGTLLILYLAEYLIQKSPEIKIAIVLNSDEESGSPDSVNIQRSLAAECRYAMIFEGARKEGRFVSQRKGIAKYRIDIEGVASHSGTAPRLGASAIVELANWIVKIDKMKNYDKGTTINVGLIKGGTALNVVAPSASAMVEVRYIQQREYERVRRLIYKLIERPFVDGTHGKVTEISHYQPLTETPETKAMLEKLEDLHIVCILAGGTSDANRIASTGIPILDGCGPEGGFPHNTGEFLRISSVEERFEMILKIIRKLAA